MQGLETGGQDIGISRDRYQEGQGIGYKAGRIRRQYKYRQERQSGNNFR